MTNNKLKITSENNNNKILVYDRVEIDASGTNLYVLQVSRELWDLLLEKQDRMNISSFTDHIWGDSKLPEYDDLENGDLDYEDFREAYGDIEEYDEEEGEYTGEWIDTSIFSPVFLSNSVKFILKAGIGMDVKFNIAYGIDGNDLETISINNIGDSFFKKEN